MSVLVVFLIAIEKRSSTWTKLQNVVLLAADEQQRGNKLSYFLIMCWTQQ